MVIAIEVSGSATANKHECARQKEPSSIHELLQIADIPLALKKNSEKKFKIARVLTNDVPIQQIKEKEKGRGGEKGTSEART